MNVLRPLCYLAIMGISLILITSRLSERSTYVRKISYTRG